MQQGSLKPEGYLPRVNDRILSDMLDTFDAVEVAGTMWCGKTWTSLAYGESVSHIGNPATRQIAEADPSTALVGVRPHVIDEWQDAPSIWDAVRNAVDSAHNSHGSYILTGSSSPRKDKVSHSGAGRIAKLKMRTMSLAETGDSSGVVSLSGLFEGCFEPQLVQQTLAPIAEAICRGGWPALVSDPSEQAAKYLDAYIDAVFETSIPKRGLNGKETLRVAKSLARNIGTSAKLATIGMDAFPNELQPRSIEKKAGECISALVDLYVIEEVSGWDAPIRSKSRLRTKPKYYFADPSLAANLLQANPERLAQDGQLFGMLFESLCIHDLNVYAAALPHAPAEPLHYYRDSDGLEVDAIIELRNGKWAAFEIKLGENKADEAFTALKRLREKISFNPAAQNPEPEFVAVIVGAGELARYDKENDAYIIPITALGA